MNNSTYDLVVIGSGPAGLTGAIAAARRGASVIVFERMPQSGLKLLASGGGNCNLCNTLPPEKFMEAFGRQGRFMQPALRIMDSSGLQQFFRKLGVETACEDGLHVFAKGDGSRFVLEALLKECARLKVVIQTDAEVSAIQRESGKVGAVKSGDRIYPAAAVLLATGGKGYPALGGSSSGYGLAHRAGHTIIEPLPADVPLVIKESWPKSLTGIALRNVRLRVGLKGFPKAGKTGDLLFTHQGLSGPVVLNSSSDISEALKKHETVPVMLDFTAGTPRIEQWQSRGGNKTVANALSPWLTGSMAKALCECCGVDPDTPASQLPPKKAEALTEQMRNCILTVCATEGFNKAMVTRGGVSLKEINPDTLESRCLPGLFLAGEVLNLDGPCGGFNLHWAFASGHLAGRNAIG
ncbi:MAG: NAD(P)/FAD-dependent oxidoreductase [Kiritimatiellales bacterium]|nr:NAD(P)/FAD-dependent oxidoreductase [Kiritimatiellales bacterium]